MSEPRRSATCRGCKRKLIFRFGSVLSEFRGFCQGLAGFFRVTQPFVGLLSFGEVSSVSGFAENWKILAPQVLNSNDIDSFGSRVTLGS